MSERPRVQRLGVTDQICYGQQISVSRFNRNLAGGNVRSRVTRGESPRGVSLPLTRYVRIYRLAAGSTRTELSRVELIRTQRI